MTDAEQSDALKKLVLWCIALALLGTIIAMAWHFGVEIPMQQALAHAPANEGLTLHIPAPGTV